MFRNDFLQFLLRNRIFFMPDDGAGGGGGEGNSSQQDPVKPNPTEGTVSKADYEALKRDLKALQDKTLSEEEKRLRHLAELEEKNKAYELKIAQGEAKIVLIGGGFSEDETKQLIENSGDLITLSKELSKIKKASDKVWADKVAALEAKVLAYQNDPAAGRGITGGDKNKDDLPQVNKAEQKQKILNYYS